MQANVSKADWTDVGKKIFIDVMLDEISKGTYTDSGFKVSSWNSIVSDFNSNTGVKYTRDQLQSQFSYMKSKCSIFRDLVDNSGFGWDTTTKLPTPPDDVWEKYLAAHKGAKEFRYKTLMFFEELEEIFAGKWATGKYARSDLNRSSSSSSSSSSDVVDIIDIMISEFITFVL